MNWNDLHLLRITGNLTGGVYSSTAEQKLDEELESSRLVRDKLGGVAEQWHTSGNLLRAAAQSAVVAFEKWSLIADSRSESLSNVAFCFHMINVHKCSTINLQECEGQNRVYCRNVIIGNIVGDGASWRTGSIAPR